MDLADREMAPATRAYQHEMFEASLLGNTIVVMDTGSGKTHIALLRIKHALQHDIKSKPMWFLAPSVILAIQQHRVICTALPTESPKLIIGSDNVERWKSPEIWAKILSRRIFVSTPEILSQVLTHGFLRITRLGLIVFDEAHHCTGDHSTHKILRSHYFPELQQHGRNELPSILGLTASPIQRSKVSPESLRELEQNLDALCRSPHVHRSELSRHVNRPRFTRLLYEQPSSEFGEPVNPVTRLLHDTILALDIAEDPYVQWIRRDPTRHAEFAQLMLTRGTRCQKELKKFLGRLAHIEDQLGSSMAESYLTSSTNKLEDSCKNKTASMIGWDFDEQLYLFRVLKRLTTTPQLHRSGSLVLAPKSIKLLAFLTARQSSATSVIFVEQRAMATMLANLLTLKGMTSQPIVGASNNSNRRASVGDFVDVRGQLKGLDDFRNGACSILVSTSTGEEGMDIPACNLVMCFDRPLNMRSFIQRRGRARHRESKFVIMLAQGDDWTKPEDWAALEEDLVGLYTGDRQSVDEELRLEETSEADARRFVVESTGAILTPDNAVALLSEFCDKLPQSQYTDHQALYIFQQDIGNLYQAEVKLPVTLDRSVRAHVGQNWWVAQRNAKRDAAFVALKALYCAGLLTDHLLPSSQLYEDLHFVIRKTASKLEIAATWEPWKTQALAFVHKDRGANFETHISISRPGKTPIRMILVSPNEMRWTIPGCELHWAAEACWTATFGRPQVIPEPIDTELAREAAEVIVASMHKDRMEPDRNDLLPLFVPCLDTEVLQDWLANNSGRVLAAHMKCSSDRPTFAVVRHPSSSFMPYLLQSWGEDDLLKVSSFPRRRNFLLKMERQASRQSQVLRKKRKIAVPEPSKRSETQLLPSTEASIDRLEEEATTFARLLPSLVRHIESSAVAMQACETILAPVGFVNVQLVKQAISASAARESVNYQQLELVGDSVLKLLSAVQLFVRYPVWHEGYLARAKDSIVANATLANAAMAKDLGQYIITSQFSPRKWKPKYAGNILDSRVASRRKVSPKLLADVVEALIGAAFVESGFIGASRCAHIFLHQIDVEEPSQTISRFLQSVYQSGEVSETPRHEKLEQLLGYHFSPPYLLIEAMTHPSCPSNIGQASYQRLEFLGDAVLEILVVNRARGRRPDISHVDMHLLKDALTNQDLLAYFCIRMSTTQSFYDVTDIEQTDGPEIQPLSKRTSLCQFMRFDGYAAAAAMQQCLGRYGEYEGQIDEAIQNGLTYPRTCLLRLGAPKFISDIVESILGAVYVDSGGDLSSCARFATQLGLLPYLDRILADSVDILHPKSRLCDLAGGKTRYHISSEASPRIGYRCHVEIKGRKYPEVGDGISKEDVTTRAAEAAIEMFSESSARCWVEEASEQQAI